MRHGLKAQGLVGQDETTVTALERLDLTDAQKRDARSYAPDSVVVFNRHVSGYKPGDSGRLLAITDKHLLIEANQRIRPVPFKDLDRLTVCQTKELPLASGDRLQLKANGTPRDGRQAGQWRTGHGQANPRGWTHRARRWPDACPSHYRQFVRGYAVTSYAAQGKIGRLCAVLRFRREGRNERTAMVCDHFAGSEGRPDFHRRQNPASPKRHPFRGPRTGLGHRQRIRPSMRWQRLGAAILDTS